MASIFELSPKSGLLLHDPVIGPCSRSCSPAKISIAYIARTYLYDNLISLLYQVQRKLGTISVSPTCDLQKSGNFNRKINVPYQLLSYFNKLIPEPLFYA